MRLHSLAAMTAVAVAAVLSGCDNSKLPTVNNNPNAPTAVPPATLFTNGVQTAVGNWLGSGYDLRNIELIVQQLAENQYIGNDQYKGVGPGGANGNWQAAYQNDLEDLQVVVRQGMAANDASLWAPALIMQQWEFGYLTDSWGDVPYSQALQGDSSVAVLAPAYDPQQQIYSGFFANLAKAATALASTTSSSLGAADPIYQGNKTKWIRFANSLRARDAMRIINADPATANTQLTAALAGGVFTSNADNAQLDWPGDNIFNNPWAVNFSSRDDDRMSKTLIDTLNHYNDPRVAVYAMPAAATGQYAGQPNGLTNATAVAYSDSASRPGAIFYPGPVAYGTGNYGGTGGSQPSYLMTFAEVSFIKAEAAERGIGGLTAAQAATFYNQGITASMNQWGITSPTTINAYLSQPQVVYQGGTAGLKQIALQKWIALFSDGGEAWFEWRRTCIPNLVPSKVAIFSYVPRRFEYPTSELSANGAQVQAATSHMGGNDNNTHVWWDKTSAAPTCQ
ncbi:MAG TPA: SusD/RagB family nutrient-binding outer membrane lipoprotein [Gemmatimonadaceae bacterium]|nr:SusD/RagB family nutrient-binding outer membrane lipoprotein [Gemmatimonadaceae bacterium]